MTLTTPRNSLKAMRAHMKKLKPNRHNKSQRRKSKTKKNYNTRSQMENMNKLTLIKRSQRKLQKNSQSPRKKKKKRRHKQKIKRKKQKKRRRRSKQSSQNQSQQKNCSQTRRFCTMATKIKKKTERHNWKLSVKPSPTNSWRKVILMNSSPTTSNNQRKNILEWKTLCPFSARNPFCLVKNT